MIKTQIKTKVRFIHRVEDDDVQETINSAIDRLERNAFLRDEIINIKDIKLELLYSECGSIYDIMIIYTLREIEKETEESTNNVQDEKPICPDLSSPIWRV